jgi:catechol 2,3-dioxygenase-like lactoylglutathione lyase family enzyme
VFDHVTIRAADREASERFYATVLPTLGIEQASDGGWGDFRLAQATSERPATRRLHIGFVAPARADVDEFWRVGTHAGYREDGPPGPRPQYGADYYGSFLLDPDGNSAEAVHHDSLRSGGAIDHLWIRVADVAVARRFYVTIAPHAGFRLRTDTPDRAQFKGDSGSFSVVAGDVPTEHVHMTFAVHDEAAVDAFHRAATRAGYRDAGGRSVLDPGGNTVELVYHNRE